MCGALVGSTISHASRAGLIVSQSPIAETVMTARGTFEVYLTPRPPDSGGGPFSRLFLDKEFRGDLAGTGKGHMLAAETKVEGSGGYVALEQITGTLNGRRGTFMLQHVGHMSRRGMTLTITVIPDSGTDELVGLEGRFVITITGGNHFYVFEYTLPPTVES
jgi:hypothetical protein